MDWFHVMNPPKTFRTFWSHTNMWNKWYDNNYCKKFDTYCCARLFLLTKTKPIYVPNFGRINNDAVTSHYIYQFTCDCGSNNIGKTERILKTRVGDYIPKWLENQIHSPYPIDGSGRYPASSIAKHLIETGHVINSSKVNVCKNKRGRMLRICWGTGYSEIDTPLCVRKQFIFSLGLPWYWSVWV